MTLYLLLAVGFVLPTGSIGFDMLREMIRDAAGIRTERDIARLTGPLPPARLSLLPEDWPQPLSPLDLPGIGHTAELAAVELRSRVFVAEPEPIVARLAVLGGRHRAGEAPGTVAQRAAWNSPTGQFWVIVDRLRDLEDPCSHCAAPEDGEPAHVGCPGCSCSCGLVTA